jgi:hypothetical protein
MECPHRQSSATTERPDSTARGYRRFRWSTCGRGFTERTGSAFNRVQYPLLCETLFRKKIIKHDWLVGEVRQEVISYACYGPFRPEAACHHTVESAIYLAQKGMGQGFEGSVRSIAGVNTEPRIREVVGVIALPNPQSIALHKATGLAEVGVPKDVGYKFREMY